MNRTEEFDRHKWALWRFIRRKMATRGMAAEIVDKEARGKNPVLHHLRAVPWWMWRLIAMLVGVLVCMATQLGPAGAAIFAAWSLYEIFVRITWWPGKRNTTKELKERTRQSLKHKSSSRTSEHPTLAKAAEETSRETEGDGESSNDNDGIIKRRVKGLCRTCKIIVKLAFGSAFVLLLIYLFGILGLAIVIVVGILLFRPRRAERKAEGKGENYDRRTGMRSAAKTYSWLKGSKWHFWWIWRAKEGGFCQALAYRWTRFYVSKDFVVQDQDPPAWLGVRDRFLTTNMASLKDETGNVQIETVRPGGFVQWFTRAGELKFKTGGEMESLRLADPNWALGQLLKLCKEQEEKKRSNNKATQQGELFQVIEKAAEVFGKAIGKALRPESQAEEE